MYLSMLEDDIFRTFDHNTRFPTSDKKYSLTIEKTVQDLEAYIPDVQDLEAYIPDVQDLEAYIPDVYEEIVGQVYITTLTNR